MLATAVLAASQIQIIMPTCQPVPTFWRLTVMLASTLQMKSLPNAKLQNARTANNIDAALAATSMADNPLR
jgi:hypothetical protein